MSRLIKQLFIALLSFSKSSATKFVSLNNKPCMIRPFLVDVSPVELNYYPFMVSLGKCSGSSNSVDEFCTKICVPSKTKDVNVKLFNLTTRTNEAKTLIKTISCDCKCKFIIQHVI